MIEIISALWPVFALVLIGYLGQRLAFPAASFWPEAERLTYYLLFPVLLVSKISTADLDGVAIGSLSLAVCLLVVVGALLTIWSRSLVQMSDEAFTSLFQGGVRFNTYVGLAASVALFPSEVVPIAAVMITVMIPLINLLCILVFFWQLQRGGGVVGLLKNLLTNPLIVACLLGFVLNFTGVGLPHALLSVADLLSKMALPLGLLAVGAGIKLQSVRETGRVVAQASLIKLVLFPMVAVVVSVGVGLRPLEAQMLILFSSLPTAPSAYILARQMGGDAVLMATIITAQTLLAMISIPAVLWLYAHLSQLF